jgi:hypothetical protein
MKFQLLGKTLLSELHWELGKNRYFRLGNPEQIMNVQDAKQTKPNDSAATYIWRKSF